MSEPLTNSLKSSSLDSLAALELKNHSDEASVDTEYGIPIPGSGPYPKCTNSKISQVSTTITPSLSSTSSYTSKRKSVGDKVPQEEVPSPMVST